MEYLWTWFLELSQARGGGGMGPASITFLDIHAWCSLRRLRLAGWELDTLLALDAAWLAAQATKK
jgi:hypothetical protein